MKAAQFSRYGGPEVIEINDVERPSPKAGQVLVAVRGAAINPFDYKLFSGGIKDKLPLKFPFTLGGDFSGIIESVGADVLDLKLGDEVYGSAMVLGGGSGSLAEFAVANAASIALKPASVDHVQAASMVLAGVSAVEAIDKLELASGQTLLIHGGAGGIGSAAIQYARNLGIHVVVTASQLDLEFVKNLGVDETIDYESEDFTKRSKKVDGVFDTVGGETYSKSFEVLASGGKIISMNMRPHQDLAKQYNVTALSQNTKVTSSSLQQLGRLMKAKVIIPQVDRIYSLDQAAQAYSHLETGHPRGKVAIEIS
jgi:NADPH:quinone reductase-like Zn-dependent oxidoreductase